MSQHTTPSVVVRQVEHSDVERCRASYSDHLHRRGDTLAGEGLMSHLHDASREYWVHAIRDGREVGIGWGQIFAGEIAEILLPWTAAGEPATTAVGLVEFLHRSLAPESIAAICYLTSLAEKVPVLEGVGYRRVGDMMLMQRQLTNSSRILEQSELSWVPCDCRSTRLHDLVHQTLVESLDFPSLSHAFDAGQLLAAFQAKSRFAAISAHILRQEGNDAGCLLLADHPPTGEIEVVYMGLVPVVRGRGLGGRLIDRCLSVALRRGRHLVTLAVDVDNMPAVQAYLSAGFEECQRRRVWWRDLR